MVDFFEGDIKLIWTGVKQYNSRTGRYEEIEGVVIEE
jgi:hypothetical protein